MQPTVESSGIDSEMKSQESLDEKNCVDLERYRNLVRTFIDLVMKKTEIFMKLHTFSIFHVIYFEFAAKIPNGIVLG